MRPFHVALLLVTALVAVAGYLSLASKTQRIPELQTPNGLAPQGADPEGKRGTMDEGVVGKRQAVPTEGADHAASEVDRFGPPIRVMVRDQESEAAVAGAKIMALGEDSSLQFSVTNTRGDCTLENPPRGLLLEVVAEGYVVQRSLITGESTTAKILLERGASVRVTVKGMPAVAAEWPVRLALIPAVRRGRGRTVDSLGAGWKSRLRKYLTSMDVQVEARDRSSGHPSIAPG